jgi:hypothetical protein
VLRYALDRFYGRVGQLGLLCLLSLAGMAIMCMVSRSAAADTDPCTDSQIRAATVQSTLKVKISGVDWPSFTSITKITIPRAWRGTLGLYGNQQQQGSSLSCFMPIGDGDFQSAPPNITVDSPPRSKSTMVNITNTITMVDGPEAGQSWPEGLWAVVKRTWGYEVTFQPENIPAASNHGQWTVTLSAPGLNIQGLMRAPTTDDGRGKLTWVMSPSRQQLTGMSVSLTSPWQVRMNLATDRWPMRWFSDASFIFGDGVLVDLVALWLGFRLLRLRRDKPEERQLPRCLIYISFLSIACYVGYVIDDYLWHNVGIIHGNNYAVQEFETIALVAIAVGYFLGAVRGIRRYPILIAVGAAWVIASAVLSLLGSRFLNIHIGAPPVAYLVIRMILLVSAIALICAGSALWISRLWPSGARSQQGYLRELDATLFRGSRIIVLLFGALLFAVLVVGQSGAASYYYWQHSDLWGQWYSPFTVINSNLRSDAHWWIGDGIQRPLYFTIIVGIFAALWAMSADARGVFFGRRTTSDIDGDIDKSGDRRDLLLMTAIVCSLFIGTWGNYDGAWVPLPFIVSFVGFAGFSLTRGLSKLDWKRAAAEPDLDSASAAGRSFLVVHRDELLSKSPDLGLPKTVDPGVTALAIGPADTWWENGVTALKTGGYLAIIPIIFDAYVLWSVGDLSQLIYPFGLQDALGEIGVEATGWLIGVFMFGVLLPYLKGSRTPVKGLVYGLIAFVAFASDAVVRMALGLSGNSYFPIDGLLAIALFVTVGVLLDVGMLSNRNADQGIIKNLYPFSSMRIAVTTLTTLIVVGVTVWQTIYLADQTAQQRAQNLSNTAQYLNGIGGIMPPSSGRSGG